MDMSMDLDAMKYTDMQRLAKDVGLKANMKADKLLKALKQFYQQQENKGANADEVDPVKAELQEVNTRSPVVASSAFITKRRGRGQKAKRKQPEDEEDNAEAEFNPAEDITQSEEKIEQGSNKKRRLSEGQGFQSGTQEEKHTKSTEKTEVKAGKEAGRKSVKPSKIPRHDGFGKTESRLKPTTPNFKKLHEAHFNKMESIDSYVQRKAKQMAVFRNSVKELKLLSEKAIPKSLDKKPMKPNMSRASLFSPVANGKRQSSENRRLTQSSTSKPVLKDSSAFKPTVLSTCKMNVRFSQTTQDNEHKRSLIKTPARMSPHVALTSTPGTQPTSQIKSAVSSNNLRTPGTFVFSGNTSSSTTPGTNKKNTFDLKASLSRPLTYQPHKGKLKPFGMTQENTSLNKSQTTLSHQKNYKQHQVQTKEDRRLKHNAGRKQKKEKMLGARRGLVMA